MLPDKKKEKKKKDRVRERERKKEGDEITGALRIYGGSGSCINSTFAQVN